MISPYYRLILVLFTLLRADFQCAIGIEAATIEWTEMHSIYNATSEVCRCENAPITTAIFAAHLHGEQSIVQNERPAEFVHDY